LEDLVKGVVDEAGMYGVEFMDIRTLKRRHMSVTVQDGKADKVYAPIMFGAGIRVLVDGMWGFASTNLVEKEELRGCLRDAVSMAKVAGRRVLERGEVAEIKPVRDVVRTQVRRHPKEVTLEEKMTAVIELEKAAKSYDPQHVVNTIVGYTDIVSEETVSNTFGTYIESETVRTLISCSVVVKEGDVRQSGFEVRGRLMGFELVEETRPEAFSVEAARKAVSLLKAEKAPAGKFPVILSPAVTGLFTHEAFGHNAEADHVWARSSILEGKVGENVTSDMVSIIDDSTMQGLHGSYTYDSEGIPGSRRVLVDKGVLKGFMHSLETAKKFGVPPNGSARAQDHQAIPVVRMSNTYIAPGDASVDEIIEETREGILLKGGYWGYVFVERGEFTCNAEEAWMVRNGELAEHLRNVSVSGLTLEALKNIDLLSKDLEFKLAGTCGKSGQGMAVDAGGPYVRVRELVVGGQR